MSARRAPSDNPALPRDGSAALPSWRSWSAPELHRRLAASQGRVLVMFGRAGCGACRAALARVPALAAGAVDAVVHVDADTSAGLLREFDVFHLPALFLYRDGTFHAPLAAALTAPGFARAVGAAFAAPAQDPP